MGRIWIFLLLLLFTFGTEAQVSTGFSANRVSGCGTVQVQFQDNSSSVNGTIVQWNWDMGGVTSSLQNPGRIFNVPGAYTICLTATDNSGQSATYCEDAFIEVYALPEPSFTAEPIIGCVPLQSSFQSLSTTQNEPIQQWIWDLGGSQGVVSTTMDTIMTSTYGKIDQYSVSLTIIDEKGCQATLSKPNFIDVTGVEPVELNVSNPVGCSLPHQAIIEIQNPGADVNYEWELSNGVKISGTQNDLSFDEFGSYDITIYAEHSISGCRDTFLFDQFVQVGLSIDFSISKYVVCAKTKVLFEDLSEIEGEILWDFGDGAFSDKSLVGHIYEEPGCYQVSLFKKIDNCETTVIADTCIQVNPLAEAHAIFDKKGSCQIPAIFHVRMESEEAIKYAFGNDSILQNSLKDTFQFEFDTPGSHAVFSMAKSPEGCWSRFEDTLFVGDLEVFPKSTGPQGCAPYSIDSIQSYFSTAFNIVSWEWMLGTTPGQESNLANPVFNMVDTGQFDLHLIVTNDEGCTDTLLLQDYVEGGMKPNVLFDALPLSGCVDSIVQFQYEGDGFANQFLWSFGDGSESFLSNPSHEYQDTGVFTVSLIAEQNGCKSFREIPDMIFIGPPIAKFTYEVNCSTNEVQFFDESIGADSIHWVFSIPGVEDTFSQQQPLIRFPSNDIFEVKLEAYNDSTGCVDEFLAALDLRGFEVSFQIDSTEGCAPFLIEPEGLGQDVVQWKWKAPGARISEDTLQIPLLEYRSSGKFPWIRLIGESSSGCRDTFLFTDTITVHKPFAKFGVLPNLVCAGETVQFIDSSVSRYLPVEKWTWIIGDSLLIVDGENPSIQFPDSAGTFPVKLVIEDSFGCQDDFVRDSAIIFTIPNPDFISDSIGCLGQIIEFRPTNYNEALLYEWDFGDGTISSEPSPEHVFTNSGNYTICLTVSNGGGCDSMECRTDYIQIVDPKVAFDADTFYANCPPLLVQFSNLSTDVINYIWDFGDGSGASELEEPGHVYTEPGVYDVQLIGVVSNVCRDTLQLDDFIRLEGPQGTFSMEVDSTCAPLEVNFFGTSIDDYKYVWDFGDGQLDSSVQRTLADTTSYRYFFAGQYLPKLILIDDEACVRSFAADDSIQVNESVIVQLAGDTSICIGDSALIHAAFLSPPTQTTFSWLPNQDLSCLDCTTSLAIPSQTSYYYFETLHQNGCIFRDSVRIGVIPLPELDIGKTIDTTACVSDTVGLFAISNALNPTYLWFSDQNEIACDNCDSVKVVLYDTSSIILSVVDSFGCANSAEVEVPVFNQHVFFAGEDQVICSGDSLLIEMKELESVKWPGNAYANCDTCLTTWIHPFETTQLVLDAIHPIGCPVRDTLFVRVRLPDEVNAGSDEWICMGESLLLEGEGFGDPIWHPGEKLDLPDVWMPTATPDTTMTFVLIANEGHCSLSDSMTVVVKTKARITAEGDTVCFGDQATVKAFGDIDDAEIFGVDVESQIESDSSFVFSMTNPAAGQYQIIGYLATCEPDTAIASIHVYPEINYSLKKDILYYPNTPIPMKLSIDEPEQYHFQWFPESYFDCAACQLPNLYLEEKSTVHVTITNQESGCQIMDSIEVRILATCRPDEFIYVPNIFTPNQDGSNDQFRIYSAVHQEIDRIQLYDRWGNLVWATEDINQSWDGMINGSPAPNGVYVYSIEGPCAIDQSIFRLKGDVTLIR